MRLKESFWLSHTKVWIFCSIHFLKLLFKAFLLYFCHLQLPFQMQVGGGFIQKKVLKNRQLLISTNFSNLTLNTTNGGKRLPSAVAARITVKLEDSIPGWRKIQLVFFSITWLKWKHNSSMAPTWKAGNCFSRWSCPRTDLNVATLLSRWGGSLHANVPSLERNSLCLLQNL